MTSRMLEIFVLGILTGLIIALTAIYCQYKIVGNAREEPAGLTAAIIREQSRLLGEALRRRRYVNC